MGMYGGLYQLQPSEASGLHADPKAVISLLNTEPSDGSYLSLEKAWHGLHYLLTGSPQTGPSPLSFILEGGSEVGPELDYGRARLLPREFVKELDASLSALSIDDLWARFDPKQMSRDKVYPEIWDEPEDDLKDEYGRYFDELKRFVREAARAGDAILIAIV